MGYAAGRVLRLAAILVVLAGATAHANPASLVPGGTDPDLTTPTGVSQSKVLIVGSVDYAYESDTASIVRESIGDPTADPLAPLPTHRDLKFKQFRHTITPRIDVGVYHDFFVYGALPIVITQARELNLDTGVARAGSSTIVDGLVPMAGFDARDPNTPTPGDLIFRGPTRKGLDQVHLGIGYAPMNQVRDDTKPTWKLGAEVRLAFGRVAKFDPVAPNANTAVGRGVHELRLWTSFDRRLGWAEPWVQLWWQVPLKATSDSLFTNPYSAFGATYTQKGQEAGVAFGFEAYAIDDPHDHNRISLDLGARFVGHFEGRDYSEMWEAFAYAGDSRGTGPLILDGDPATPGLQAASHPGISNLENYFEYAGRVALRAELGPHVRFAVLADFIKKTDHVITFADAGVDKDGNDLVNPGTAEVNPLHVDRIDLVGHRYRSQENFGFVIGVEGQLLF